MTDFDAIVVGSGAAGSWVAKELTERGKHILLLEAGPSLDKRKDFAFLEEGAAPGIQIVDRMKAFLGGQAVQSRCMPFNSMTRRFL